MRGSNLGTETCLVADGDPSINIENLLRYSPESGIAADYLLTGPRKRAEPYQSILLNQQQPVVQPTGTYNVVNTSAFSVGEVQNPLVSGYKTRFPQMLDRPGPAEMVPKESNRLRNVDIHDFDAKDPVTGKAPKNETSMASTLDLDTKTNQAMTAYQNEFDVNAKTLPFRGSNWAATHPELVNQETGTIPVYDTDGNVISNIKAKVDNIPLQPLPSASSPKPMIPLPPPPTKIQNQNKNQNQNQNVTKPLQPAKPQKKNTLGIILITVAGVVLVGILVTVILMSSSPSSSSSSSSSSPLSLKENVFRERETPISSSTSSGDLFGYYL